MNLVVVAVQLPILSVVQLARFTNHSPTILNFFTETHHASFEGKKKKLFPAIRLLFDPTRCQFRLPTNDRPSSLAEQTTKISTSKEERVWMLCDTKPDATHLPKYSKWLSSSMDPSHSIGWQQQRGGSSFKFKSVGEGARIGADTLVCRAFRGRFIGTNQGRTAL